METPENLTQLWKLVALASVVVSLLFLLFSLLLYQTRYRMGRIYGAMEMLRQTCKYKPYYERHKLYIKFCGMVEEELGSGDLCDEIKGEALTQIRE